MNGWIPRENGLRRFKPETLEEARRLAIDGSTSDDEVSNTNTNSDDDLPNLCKKPTKTQEKKDKKYYATLQAHVAHSNASLILGLRPIWIYLQQSMGTVLLISRTKQFRHSVKLRPIFLIPMHANVQQSPSHLSPKQFRHSVKL